MYLYLLEYLRPNIIITLMFYYIEVKKLIFILEIDILRISSQKN